jgi:hypothetical protein
MREFVKSCSSFALAMSFFGLKQLENMLTPTEGGERRGPAAKAFDSVTNATTDQLGGSLRSGFEALDNLQRGMVGLAFQFLWPFERDYDGDVRRAEAEAGEGERWARRENGEWHERPGDDEPLTGQVRRTEVRRRAGLDRDMSVVPTRRRRPLVRDYAVEDKVEGKLSERVR